MPDDQEQSYYDVLGVDPNASKDEIREAYRERLGEAQAAVTDAETAKRPEGSRIASARAEEASVRSAWQVLSDPVQRERHDSSIGVSRDAPGSEIRPDDEAGADDGADTDDGADRTPARRGAAANGGGGPQPPQRITLLSREHPPTPPSWPPGLVPPPPRARTLAMAVDIAVLIVMLLVTQIAIVPAVLDEMYPKERAQLEATNDDIDRLDACIERRPRQPANEPAVCQTDDGEPLSKSRLENKQENFEERAQDLVADTQTGALIVFLGLMIAMLLYLIPSSLRSGRTLGKHLFQIRAVNEDGSPLNFRSALARYGLPVIVAVVLGSVLGPLQPLIAAAAIFGVLMWQRNASYQGLHDRFAHTIVVDG